MSYWRVLELSEQPDGEQIPQLLVKLVFGPSSYTVHLTCLSNIWSEELDLEGVVDRASQEQSPIEVSKHDTAQLAILLDHVRRSLENSNDVICRLTRDETDGITLHTTVSLPKPLDSLTWKFHLHRGTSTVLKNELILPLLISSHVQHERLAALITTINEKDKAITRLVDQFESSNLDLAAAFPIVSGLKSGRKAIKREQAARHVPALQPFSEDAFKQKTEQSVDANINSLGLFQEALSECTSEVPTQLKSADAGRNWWTAIPNHLSKAKTPVKSKAKKPAPIARPMDVDGELSEDETEDEFETHANFKTRNLPSKAADAPKHPHLLPPNPSSSGDDDVTEDDEDLDAPPESQSQRSSQTLPKPLPPCPRSSTPEDVPPQKRKPSPAAKAKALGFRIGGKAKKAATESPPPDSDDLDVAPAAIPSMEPPSSQVHDADSTSPKRPKRTFRIGGKGKTSATGSSQATDPITAMADRTIGMDRTKSQAPSPKRVKEETPPVEEEVEETPEEKAERRRAELKRKTEEAAKKQAQSKKKRRF